MLKLRIILQIQIIFQYNISSITLNSYLRFLTFVPARNSKEIDIFQALFYIFKLNKARGETLGFTQALFIHHNSHIVCKIMTQA